MKVKDFIEKIQDNNTYILFRDKDCGAISNYYTKNELKRFNINKYDNRLIYKFDFYITKSHNKFIEITIKKLY